MAVKQIKANYVISGCVSGLKKKTVKSRSFFLMVFNCGLANEILISLREQVESEQRKEILI